MYTSLLDRPDVAADDGADDVGAHGDPARPSKRRRGAVTGNVVALGLTSLFTDISAEMVTAVMPLYLTFQLRFAPWQLGLFEGAYQGITGLLRVGGGVAADRWRRHKEVAGAGYGLSAASKLGLLATSAWAPVTGLLFADRVGKGIRTAPRDALISLSTRPERLGLAFGVHRALDTVGALLGPILAFLVLRAAPGEYDAVFAVSFCFAMLGLAILTCFVRNPPGRRTPGLRSRPTGPIGLLRIRAFRRLALAAGILAAATVGDSLLYLCLRRSGAVSAGAVPLLFVGTALAYLALALPCGRLADRVGRGRLFLGGHLLLGAAYATLWLGPPTPVTAMAVVGLLGAYYACTDGVLMAMASTMLPASSRTSGLAVVTTASAAGRFAAATVFGLVWSAAGATTALAVTSITLGVALVAGAALVAPTRPAQEAP